MPLCVIFKSQVVKVVVASRGCLHQAWTSWPRFDAALLWQQGINRLPLANKPSSSGVFSGADMAFDSQLLVSQSSPAHG